MRKAIVILVLGALTALGAQDVTKAEAKQAKGDFAAQQNARRSNKRAQKRFEKSQTKAMKRMNKRAKVKTTRIKSTK